MFKVYEINYYGRARLVGEAENLKAAKSLERAALKKSSGEYPTFIDYDGTTGGAEEDGR